MNNKKYFAGLVTVAIAALLPCLARAEVSCTRGGLQEAVNLYLAAQTKGDLTGLPLATGVGYWENIAPADIKQGFVTKPLKIDFSRSVFDTDTCQSYTEVIVTDKAAPYVLGTRLRVNHDKIAEVEVLWTTTGYWLFNAEAYLKYSSTEKWEPIAAEQRDTRGRLLAAANAYLDAFLEKKIDRVPWGFPCVRIEGGAYTGKGTPADSCEVGVPGGVNITNRRFVVDELMGTVTVFCTFGAGTPNGGSGAPDMHLFRIENGKLRYVHTLTHLLQSAFREPPAAAHADNNYNKGVAMAKLPNGVRHRVWWAVVVFLVAQGAEAAQMGSGDPSPTNDTELGFIVFQQNCTACHGNPAVERAPTPAQLRAMPPERILTALTTGLMKTVGDTLTDTQRRKVAASLAGRPLGSDVAGDARHMPNRCSRDNSSIDVSASPRWNGWGIDTDNSRFQPGEQAQLTAADVPRLKLKWAFGLPNSSSSYSQPTVVSGRVFVGADTGYVYALDAKTGCVHWSFKARAGVRNAMTLGLIKGITGVSTAVYFGDLLANVYALDARTGRQLWTRQVGQHYSNRITAAPAFHDGRLYVPVSSWEGIAASIKDYPCCQSIGAVVALNANTGKLRWRTLVIPEGAKPLGPNPAGTPLYGPSGAPVWNTPTVDVARRRVYFGTGDATTFPAAATSDAVMAVDLDTGKVAWTYQVFRNDSFLVGCPVTEPVNNCPKTQGPDFDIPASVVLRKVNGRDVLYVATKPGDILALDPDHDGALLWRKNLTGEVVGENAQGSRSGLAAPANGVLWGGAFGSEVAYFGLTRGGVAAMRIADGQPLWQRSFALPPGGRAGNSAAASAIPGVVFIGSTEGTLHALSTIDGSSLWQYDTHRSFDAVNHVATQGGSISSGGAVVVGGQVFVGSGFGVVGGLTGNAVLAFGVD